jgi:hypothetical protein
MILTTQHYVRHYANDRNFRDTGKENNVLTFLDFLFREKNVLFVGGLDELEILEYVIGRHGWTEARIAPSSGIFSFRVFSRMSKRSQGA